MKRFTVAVLALLGLVVVAAPAQADGPVTPVRLSARTVCVLPDFPVTGSGWKVQAAVAAWNEAEHVVRLTTAQEPGCATVYVHRYWNTTDDNVCGYTSWERTWYSGQWASDGAWLVDGADVYLNDACDMGAYASRRVVAHELGHVMGLGHTSGCRSVMSDDCLVIGREHVISRGDVLRLAALYRQ